MSVKSCIKPTVRPASNSAVSGAGGEAAADPLVFHAFDDVLGTFSADVIVGTGTVTEGRTSTIYAPDDSNVFQSFGSGVPAETYAGGQWWVQAQPALTNSITYSRDLTNAAWTETGTSVAAYDAVGLTGAANTASTLTDDNGAGLEYIKDADIVPDDSNTHVLRIFIKKDADTTRYPEIDFVISGSSSNNIFINTQTGATATRSSLGTVSEEVRDAGDWWEVLISIQNDATGNTSLSSYIIPAASTDFSARSNAATGSIIVGNVELHKNTTIAAVRGSGPIFTSGSAVTTNASDDSFDDADHSATQGGYYIEWTPQFSQSEVSGDIEIVSLNNGAGLLYYDATNSQLEATDGTNTAVVALTIIKGTTYKCWVAYGGTSLQVGFNSTTGTAGTFDGAFATGTKIEVVTPSPGAALVRNFRHYNSDFDTSVSTLQGLAA